MLRDKSLVPLSRQHQHALALCVRIDRASPIEESKAGEWQAEMAVQFEAEIKVHFVAEEQFVFPAARGFEELEPLVVELLEEHRLLRGYFGAAEARNLSADEIPVFARRLSEHIRKEERQLFERLQEVLSPEQLTEMGLKLNEALKDSAQICAVPAKNPDTS